MDRSAFVLGTDLRVSGARMLCHYLLSPQGPLSPSLGISRSHVSYFSPLARGSSIRALFSSVETENCLTFATSFVRLLFFYDLHGLSTSFLKICILNKLEFERSRTNAKNAKIQTSNCVCLIHNLPFICLRITMNKRGGS